jgi:FAD/FMN-containing dehydrogenase
MAQEITATIESLRQSMAGSVITPEDTEYDQARRVWNAHIDRRPAVIVQCASAQDVAAALGFAQAAGLEIAVRGGAHSFPGYSVCDDGLVVDLRRMNGVIIDPEAKRARVQGGALLADLDAAAQAHGLAVTAGIVGHTGVAGLTLGGGYGWLTRLAGLSIDNLLGAEVVVADGRILRASGDENSDLFWAIRGGGGNFGVVTEFEFRLLDVDPMVQFGFFFWGQDQARAALRLMRDVIPGLPRSLNALPVGDSRRPLRLSCQSSTISRPALHSCWLASATQSSTKRPSTTSESLNPRCLTLSPRCRMWRCRECSTNQLGGASTTTKRVPTTRTSTTR